MVDVIVAGILIAVILGILCFAAYMIKAESFEFTTAILKMVSFSIKIVSPRTKKSGSSSSDADKPGPSDVPG